MYIIVKTMRDTKDQLQIIDLIESNATFMWKLNSNDITTIVFCKIHERQCSITRTLNILNIFVFYNRMRYLHKDMFILHLENFFISLLERIIVEIVDASLHKNQSTYEDNERQTIQHSLEWGKLLLNNFGQLFLTSAADHDILTGQFALFDRPIGKHCCG